ncbi:hypothetical protein HELRODRAFT_184092 [Helobdella robusta]|uniref:Uncharacterized protein n=1 Tax=Helobdella robusta TaxID=6412 RepID=T1FKK4_HELRO|nr:hypothetical protein HELRODRAFT_184092 [Helobdella robusta]ESO08260.1 hypothetical protein HELRODRAFT_184092 [Helobdella robusta]
MTSSAPSTATCFSKVVANNNNNNFNSINNYNNNSYNNFNSIINNYNNNSIISNYNNFNSIINNYNNFNCSIINNYNNNNFSFNNNIRFFSIQHMHRSIARMARQQQNYNYNKYYNYSNYSNFCYYLSHCKSRNISYSNDMIMIMSVRLIYVMLVFTHHVTVALFCIYREDKKNKMIDG